jgi:hypothetical protein
LANSKPFSIIDMLYSNAVYVLKYWYSLSLDADIGRNMWECFILKTSATVDDKRVY